MSTAVAAPRQIGYGSLLATVFGTHLRLSFMSKKTIALAVVMFLPVAGGAVYLSMGGVGGLDVFKALMEYAVVTFLMPLICLFYGGPAVVEEIEGRTITYLFLRPVSKSAIFLGKTAAAAVVSLVLLLVPLVPLFFICMAAGGDVGASMPLLAKSMVSVAVGAVAYTVVFAAIGALFARSLLAGILYWGAVEWGMSLVPVLEFGTLKFHILNAATLIDTQHMGMLDRMVLGENPIEIPIWASYSALVMIGLFAAAAGAWVFQNRQYVI